MFEIKQSFFCNNRIKGEMIFIEENKTKKNLIETVRYLPGVDASELQASKFNKLITDVRENNDYTNKKSIKKSV